MADRATGAHALRRRPVAYNPNDGSFPGLAGVVRMPAAFTPGRRVGPAERPF